MERGEKRVDGFRFLPPGLRAWIRSFRYGTGKAGTYLGGPILPGDPQTRNRERMAQEAIAGETSELEQPGSRRRCPTCLRGQRSHQSRGCINPNKVERLEA
jgi:hypothetical protein